MDDKDIRVLGYDIGGTKIAVCIGDGNGEILAHGRLPSEAGRNYAEVLPDMVALGRRLIAEAGLSISDICACGVCAPGPLDIANGLLLKSPNMVWDKAPIRDDLARHLGITTFLDNDANAGVLAEWQFGAARGLRDVIYLTMSTGVGGGVVTSGCLMQGATGVGAELGHIILDTNGPLCGCGMRGCLEAFCGGKNVSLRLQAMLADRPEHAMMKLPEVAGDPANLGYPAVLAGVRQEIPLALELWDEVCFRLAQGIGSYLMTFNPEAIILGTVAHYAGALLLNPVQAWLPRFAWDEMRRPCRLAITSLGEKIGEMAGMAVALYGLQHRAAHN